MENWIEPEKRLLFPENFAHGFRIEGKIVKKKKQFFRALQWLVKNFEIL